MANFFEKFPRISYDIQGKRLTNYNLVTNIFFRTRVIREVLANISAYYEYLVKDDDTPEILAEKVYGDSEAHWLILMANDIVDPQYDWPLNTRDFQNYMYKKYYYSADKAKLSKITINNSGTGYSNGFIVFSGGNGISANAKVTVNSSGSIVQTDIINYGSKYFASDNVVANVSHLGGTSANLTVVLSEPSLRDVLSWTQDTTNANSIHHYEKVIVREESFSGIIVENRYQINKANIAISMADTTLPYDTYDSLAETQDVDTINMTNGRTVIEITNREAITFYDYENQQNENKRAIKIIKPEYYAQIIREFDTLVVNRDRTRYIRRLV